MAPRLLIKVMIADIREEAVGIKSFTFVPVHRRALPGYRGGAHVILQLADGKRRNYSLCGDPRDRSRYRVAVLREPEGRGASLYLHDRAAVGDVMWLTHPQEDFALDRAAEHQMLIAGGIGITPILGMLRDLEPRSSVEVHYCARSEERAAFLDEVSQLADDTHVHISDRGDLLDVPGLLRERRRGTHVACCGPNRLMDAVRAATVHWPDEAVRFEAFVGVNAVTEYGESFDVELAASKLRLHVPADRSLLDVLQEAGITVDSACESGICGTCKVHVLKGTAVHRDLCLSAEERRDTMLACVSRGDGLVSLLL